MRRAPIARCNSSKPFANDRAGIRLDHRETQADQVGVTAVFMACDLVQEHTELLELTALVRRLPMFPVFRIPIFT